MASVVSRRAERGGRRWVIWAIVALVIVGLGIGGFVIAQNLAASAAQAAAAANWRTADVVSGPIDASVSATGNIEPKAEANVQFLASGNVTEILVSEGERVTRNQPLAKLDSADLELGVVRAEADVKQARADYERLLAGSTKEDIAQAQAQLAQARGSYNQTVGSVTSADVSAARANLAAAQEKLNQLQAGPTSEVLRASEASVQQAQTTLTNQRDGLSAAKTNAELGLSRAVNTLTQAQSAYASAKSNWDYVQQTGNDPVNPSSVGANGAEADNKLNEAQRQQYRDAFVQAESSLRNAEAGVQQAQVEFDTARQNEAVGVQSAEQQLANAQADLGDVQAGATSDELASARAQVESAQAELARLTGGNRSGSLEAAQAGVASAEAALAKLTASPAPSDLAISEAGVTRAEAALKQAQRSLEEATLRAPFDATVTRINVRVGESSTVSGAASSGGAVDLADLSAYHVEVPIDELDIAQVQQGSTARITLDAAPDAELEGTVANIAPIATQNEQGTTTYAVRVDIQATEARIMPGMTASVDIITSQKNDAVLVPRRAIQTENNQNFVWVPTNGQPDLQAARPASERRDVQLGLSNAEFVEITSGLQLGDKVLVPEVSSTLNPFEAN